MTAEQFVDAIGRDHRRRRPTPRNDDVFVAARLPTEAARGRPFVRASLVQLDAADAVPRPAQPRTGRHDPAGGADDARSTRAEQRPAARRPAQRGAEKLLADTAKAVGRSMCRIDCSAPSSAASPPTDELARLAEIAGDPLTPDGLADVLWCIVMLPEFQLVR